MPGACSEDAGDSSATPMPAAGHGDTSLIKEAGAQKSVNEISERPPDNGEGPVRLFVSIAAGNDREFDPRGTVVVVNMGKRSVRVTDGPALIFTPEWYEYKAFRYYVTPRKEDEARSWRFELPSDKAIGNAVDAVLEFGSERLAPGQFACYSFTLWQILGRRPDVVNIEVRAGWVEEGGDPEKKMGAKGEFHFTFPYESKYWTYERRYDGKSEGSGGSK